MRRLDPARHTDGDTDTPPPPVNCDDARANPLPSGDCPRHPGDRERRRRVRQLDELTALPAWPFLMNAVVASRYLGLSIPSFLGLVRRKGVRPVDLGLSLVRWRRTDLEALVADLPAKGDEEAAQSPLADFDQALKKASARRLGTRQRRSAAA